MKDALNFLIGKEVKIKNRSGKSILQAGNVDGSYYLSCIRFTASDVESIQIHKNGEIVLTLKGLK